MKNKKIYLTFDCETGNKEAGKYLGSAFIWSCSNGQESLLFRSFIELLDWVYINYFQNKEIYLFAHNGSHFDNFFVLKELKESFFMQFLPDNHRFIKKGYSFSLLGDYSKIIKIDIMYKDLKIHILDSILKIPITLKKMGELVNIPKIDTRYNWSEQEIDLMLDIAFKNKDVDNKEYNDFVQYAKDDALILYKFLEEYYKDNLDNLTTITLASEAYKMLKWTKTLPKLSEEQWNYFKLSYRGGYCNFNRKYVDTWLQDSFLYIDINSSYPARCINNALPIAIDKEELFNYEVKPSDYEQLIDSQSLYEIRITAECWYEDLREIIPHNIINSSNTFKIDSKIVRDIIKEPADNITNYRHSVKDHYMLVWGCELKWILTFYNVSKLFLIKKTSFLTSTEYSETMVEVMKNKVESKTAFDKLRWKNLANSSTGKFGQSPYMDTIWIDRVIPKVVYKNFDVCDSEIGNHKKLLKNSLKPNEKLKFIPIISYITALSRCALYEMFHIYGDKVIYSDTDSCIIKSGSIDLIKDKIDDKIIGKWKVELETFCYFKTLGPKHYVFLNDLQVLKKAHGGYNFDKTFDLVGDVFKYYKNGMITKSNRMIKLPSFGCYIEEYEKEISII